MFYEPKNGHGLKHNPFGAVVSPRPIGWISTRADGRDNLAPYSFFNAVAYEPPQVMFASTMAKEDQGDTKDSVANIRASGVFCTNVVEFAMWDVMMTTSERWAKDIDEYAQAGIEKAECTVIDAPRVANAPASFECEVVDIIKVRGETNYLVVGEVVGVHLRDDCVVDGMFDVLKYNPLTRLGYRDYSRITEVMTPPAPKS